jgi:K+-sensing histidine kinase KdpD
MTGYKWIIGSAVCAGTAGLMVAIFREQPGRESLPLVFLAVITLVALYFGVAAGILGSLSAAVVFALFLFPPLGSPLINDLSERSNVGWMLLGGITISYLFAPRAPTSSKPTP